MRVVSLGSGSSGNALLVEAGPNGRTKLLIDAGLRANVLIEGLYHFGVHPSELRGVLLTHEHSDHVIGLPVLLKRYNFPVIADPRTYQAVEESVSAGLWRTDSGTLVSGGIEADVELRMATSSEIVVANGHEEVRATVSSVVVEVENLRREQKKREHLPLEVGSSCRIGDINVTSFPVSHDAVAPCGYLLEAGGCRVCIAIDSGEVTPPMLDMMQQADLLILEANHDRTRLLRGPYPQSLKNRILSSTGHLSNEQAAEAILRTWHHDSVRWIWLAHLSRTNNTPRLALRSVREYLKEAKVNLFQVHFSVLPPYGYKVWDSTQLWQAASLWEMPL